MQTSAAAQRSGRPARTLHSAAGLYCARFSARDSQDEYARIAIIAALAALCAGVGARPEPRAVSLAADPLHRREAPPAASPDITSRVLAPASPKRCASPWSSRTGPAASSPAARNGREERADGYTLSRRRRRWRSCNRMVKDLAFDPRRDLAPGRAGLG